MQETKRKHGRGAVISTVAAVLLIPLTIAAGQFFPGDRKYYIISLLIILYLMLPFFAAFESRKPQPRELVIIAVMCAVAIGGRLAFFWLPQFKPMFDQMETLPFLTQVLFDVSDFVGANWPVLLVAAALIVFGGKLLLAQPKVRRQWDRFILHAPVVGVLNRKICTARFASTLSNLYGSGVPIITTLAAARDAIGNRWIESQFGDALDSIRAGHSLSEAIAGIDGFEVKLSSSVAVGEETGKLDSLLATISETLDYEAEMATKRLVTLLEPVMIVVMGLVVGGVVAAVIVPIYQSYGTIGASSGAI